jgi:hypothetical protein
MCDGTDDDGVSVEAGGGGGDSIRTSRSRL